MIWTQEENKASGLERTVQILIAECQACGTHDCSIVLVYYKSPQAAIFSVTVTDLEILCLFFLNEHLCCLMFHVSHVNWVMLEPCTNGLQCLPCCKTVSCRIKTSIIKICIMFCTIQTCLEKTGKTVWCKFRSQED